MNNSHLNVTEVAQNEPDQWQEKFEALKNLYQMTYFEDPTAQNCKVRIAELDVQIEGKLAEHDLEKEGKRREEIVADLLKQKGRITRLLTYHKYEKLEQVFENYPTKEDCESRLTAITRQLSNGAANDPAKKTKLEQEQVDILKTDYFHQK